MILTIPKYFKRSDFCLPGMYFMFKGAKIVYIGKSINFLNRLFAASHTVEYDIIRVISCDVSKLDYYEKRWIKKFRPELNFRHLKKAIGKGRRIIVDI